MKQNFVKTVLSCLAILLLVIAVACSSSKSASASNNSSSNTASTDAADISANGARDGLSIEEAIVVKSIGAEYDWIKANYPGAKVIQQSLIRRNGKPYDQLTFVTPGGETKDAYFDISKFYGKF